MRTSAIILFALMTASVVLSEQRAETRDLVPAGAAYEDEDPEELGRGRRKRKKQQQQQQHSGPCAALGFGRTFGDKLFGWGGHTPAQTYVSAPVYNYYIGCGGGGGHQYAPPQPFFPAPPPQPFPGHNHNHNHNHGHHGGGGGGGGGFNQYQPYHDEGAGGGGYPQRPQRPVANVVSAAASGLGSALADYVTGGTRPKKTYKQINKAVNQLFRPIYKFF